MFATLSSSISNFVNELIFVTATRMSRFSEDYAIAEDVEEEDGRFGESFLQRMRSPLLPTTTTNTEPTNDAQRQQLRHRSTASAASAVLVEDAENPADMVEFQHQQQQNRILDRNGTFGQSRGRWGVERNLAGAPLLNERRRNSCCRFFCCCRWSYYGCGKDWFFWLAYKKTPVLFVLLFLSYATIIGFFGFIYLSLSIFGSHQEVNPDGSTKVVAFCDMGAYLNRTRIPCDWRCCVALLFGMRLTSFFLLIFQRRAPDINDHMEAMYFSLSTMTTIGYGVSDYYFGGCYSPLLIVLMQICTAIVFDAVAVGLIFHRISRGASRSRSILFSERAVVRNIKGVPHLMFRLGERRKYQLLEATVRCYCIRHERIPNYYPHSAKEVAAHLSGTTTTTDASEDGGNDQHQTPRDFRVHVETTSFASRQMRLIQPDDRFGSHLWMGLPQVVVHRIDEKSPLLPSAPLWFDAGGNAHRYPPPESTESLPSSQDVDLLSNSGGASGSGGSSPPNQRTNNNSNNKNLASIQTFLMDRDVEIVVLVEGTDEGTGASTQARHSYKLSDIAWNHRFADCVQPYSRRQRSGPSNLDPVLSIDFARFHDILPAPVDCEACAYVPNVSFHD
jgi:potassium inwardly-rectifying channel subfamily J